MRAAAPPPTALNSDTSCGIAVIFTVRAVYSPRPPPRARPARMMTQPATLRPSSRVSGARKTAVAPSATAMPPADRRLPFRAVAGEFIRMRPMTKATAPATQATRTRVSRTESSMSDLRLLGLGGRGLAPEHLEHPVGHDVAADDV